MSWTSYISANGVGCMVQSILFTYAWSKLNDQVFKFTKFLGIHHGTSVSKAIQFFGFDKIEPADIHSEGIDYNMYGFEKDGVVDELLTDEVMDYFRSIYRGNKEKKDVIAIHIRRGDVNAQQHADRYIELKRYIPIIAKFREKYPQKPIYIVSEGRQKDFEILGDNLHFKIGGCALQTLEFLIQCDVLFVARSSFSYVAGLYSTNEVYCDFIVEPSWFSYPKKHWKRLID
tara:strand:- start:16 stop:705 length:690 start_codon:yes stop_codon:yes gene_type:complete